MSEFKLKIPARRFIKEGGKLIKDQLVFINENATEPKILDQYKPNGLCKVIDQECFGYHIDNLWVEVTAIIE